MFCMCLGRLIYSIECDNIGTPSAIRLVAGLVGERPHFGISPPVPRHLPASRPPSSPVSEGQFESLVALVGQDSTTMTFKTRKNTQEPAAEDGGVRSTLKPSSLSCVLSWPLYESAVKPSQRGQLRPSCVSQAACSSSRRSAAKTCASGSSKWRHCVKTLRLDGSCSGRRKPVEEQTWAQFTQDALAHFEASNYQAVLRQKLCQLHQVDDIENYNGKYSALIFRVENMSEEDQVSYYCDGLKRATQAYVKLQNPMTLSEAMDQAVKYEMFHFGGDSKTNREKPEREQRFRGKPRANHPRDKKPFSKRSFKPGHYAPTEKDKEGHVCYYCKMPVHSKHDCKKLKSDQENDQPRHWRRSKFNSSVYPKYPCIAVVFNIPDEFDRVLGMPFFVDVQPNIDWKHRCFKNDDFRGDSAMNTSTSYGKCSQANDPGLHDAVDSESSTTRSRDSCRAAVPETRPECKVELAERPSGGVKNLSRREKRMPK
ncbi:unnamed protein product [Phytophthora fragariaefolia]|uniref:Unnamed protein product n=1 Tax=Phytophthora fragariaefolia TaxID=1490495 RepID=A0A9W6Y3I1_9STRA|nr:unnamed protein product [Phytophthora fragariaefolia]